MWEAQMQGAFAWGLKGCMEGLSLTEVAASSRGFGRQAEAAIKDQFRCVWGQKSIICLGVRFVSMGGRPSVKR